MESWNLSFRILFLYMKGLNTYITEKLHIKKGMKVSNIIDTDNSQVVEDIMVAACLSCLRKKRYSENSTFQKKMVNPDYSDIKNILEKYFNYKVTNEDIKFRKGAIWQVVSDTRQFISFLMNGKKFTRPGHKFNEDPEEILDGREIIKKYADILKENVSNK